MPSDHEQMLQRMSRLPGRIQRLIADESDEDLCRAGAGGTWGAVEHIAHLKDFDQVTLERVDLILQQESPEIADFDSDVRAIERNYHAENPRASAADFEKWRTALVNRLDALSDDEWLRTARHPDLGSLTLDTLIKRLDEHDAQHFRALKDVLV